MSFTESTDLRRRARGFTLIEILVSVSIIAMLLAVLLPALSRAREAGRAAVCLSNLKQAHLACQLYANEHKGLGPALGVPWGRAPFWGIVVQEYAGATGQTPSEVYSPRSVLVCPTIQRFYAREMTRTYAMNVTGRAGLTELGDRESYDETVAQVDWGRVERPSDTPLLVDSAVAFFPSDAPPPTRTSSVIDFRQDPHVRDRLGRFHGGGEGDAFQAAMYDGSGRLWREIPQGWQQPLPS